MKIIQLNSWQGKLGSEIIDFLREENPDIVCMQEVNDLRGRAGYKFFATLDEVKDKAGFSQAFMSPTYSSRYMERELEYGNAILSKQPIVSSQTVFTSGQYIRNFDIEKDDGNIRNLQIAAIDVGDKRLSVINHHGHRVRGTKAGNEETFKQMQIIEREISKIDGPIIMCGDFNLAPDSDSLKLINKKLTNLSVANNLLSTYSQLSENNVVCDYIFVNDKVKVQNFKMSDELVSDHNALILEFGL